MSKMSRDAAEILSESAVTNVTWRLAENKAWADTHCYITPDSRARVMDSTIGQNSIVTVSARFWEHINAAIGDITSNP